MDTSIHIIHKRHREAIFSTEARSSDNSTKREKKRQKGTRKLKTTNTTTHILQDNIINTGKEKKVLQNILGKEQNGFVTGKKISDT